MKKVRIKHGEYELDNTANTRQRPALSAVSDQMRAWSSALAGEIAGWPGATVRSFFGFTALYRGNQIFGALPRTRSFGNGNLLGFRIDDLSSHSRSKVQEDHRIGFIDEKNRRWFTFELSRDYDLHEALEWLGEAYQAAGKRRKSKK